MSMAVIRQRRAGVLRGATQRRTVAGECWLLAVSRSTPAWAQPSPGAVCRFFTTATGAHFLHSAGRRA